MRSHGVSSERGTEVTPAFAQKKQRFSHALFRMSVTASAMPQPRKIWTCAGASAAMNAWTVGSSWRATSADMRAMRCSWRG